MTLSSSLEVGPECQRYRRYYCKLWESETTTLESRHVAGTIHVVLNSLTYRTELGKNLNADEAVALGAVYQGAGHSKMFRVKKFLVKEGTVFPIQVLGDVVTTISICLGIGRQRC